MSFKKEIEFLENNPHNIFVVNYGKFSSNKTIKNSINIEHRIFENSKKVNIKINDESFKIIDDIQKKHEHIFCVDNSSYSLNSDFKFNSQSITINDINFKNSTNDDSNIEHHLTTFLNSVYSFMESNNNVSEFNYTNKESNKVFESKESTLNALDISIKNAKENFPIKESCIFDPNILEVEHVVKKISSNLNEMLFQDSPQDKLNTLDGTIKDVKGLKNIMSIYVKDGFLNEMFGELINTINNVRTNISKASNDIELTNKNTVALIKQLNKTETLFQKEHGSYYDKYKEIETLEHHHKVITEQIQLAAEKELLIRPQQSFTTIVIPNVFLKENNTLKNKLKEEGVNYNKFLELNKALNLSKNPELLIEKLKQLSSESQIETVYYINNVNSSSKIKNLLADKKKKSESKPSVDRSNM
jgi:hypothetical protein